MRIEDIIVHMLIPVRYFIVKNSIFLNPRKRITLFIHAGFVVISLQSSLVQSHIKYRRLNDTQAV